MAAPDFSDRVASIPFTYIATKALPSNLRDGDWPAEFFETNE
jgi:hypothetical protein